MKKIFFLSFSLALLLFSCKYKLSDKPNWDADVLAPLLTSRVTINDALQDTTIFQTNPDNSIMLVFRDTVVNFMLADYVVVPDTEVQASVTLDSISLSTDTLNRDITLGEIARALKAQGNAMGDFILNSHGNTVPFFPAISGVSSGDVNIDASQFFQEADLLQGYMDVIVENWLAVDITQVTFNLRNATLGDTLVKEVINNIPHTPTPPGNNMVKRTADLAGKHVESSLIGELQDISTASGTNVKIDTTDYVRLTIIVRDLKASAATAIFPSQRVIDDNTNVLYTFGEGVEITRMTVGSGSLKVTAISTINDTLEFIYRLPSAIKDGQSVEVTNKLNPAPVGGQVVQSIDFDLTDYFIDLTVNGDSVNLFPQHLIGNLIYSGNIVSMDLQDSIYVYYGLIDIKPKYIEGYIGKDTLSFQESISIDFFKNILGGTLDLNDPKVDLTFINSIGVDGELQISNITAKNTRNGNSVTLTGSPISSPVNIVGPKLPNVGQKVATSIHLDANNSNIKSFIALLPDQIDFDLTVFANKNGVPALRNNFATDESAITALMDIEMPLEGVADKIILQDTIDFNMNDADPNTEKIQSGTLKFILQNSFPMDAVVQMYFYDPSNMVVDSIFASPATVAAGIIDGNGIVQSPTKSKFNVNFDQNRINNLKRSTYVIARFTLSTKPNGQPVKLYSTYGIDFKLIGDFIYNIGSRK